MINLKTFGGLLPILKDDILPENGAASAVNCDLTGKKVVLRTAYPAWASDLSPVVDDSNRKYKIGNDGYLYEDNVKLHMGKPSAPVCTLVSYWTLESEVTAGHIKLVSRFNQGATMTPSSCTRNADGTYNLTFSQPGYRPEVIPASGGTADIRNLTLKYNDTEHNIKDQVTIFNRNDTTKVYATLYFEEITWVQTTPPGSGSIIVYGFDFTVKCTVIKNCTKRNYVVTYWDGRHESPPSDISNELSVCEGDTVTVAISQYTGGHGTHTNTEYPPAFYIYRTGGSLTSADYYYVDKLSASGNYSDTREDYLLQEKLSKVTNPPVGMSCLVKFGGCLAACKNGSVYFCEYAVENNWPPEYEYKCKENIKGIRVMGNSILVLTDTSTHYILRGTMPDSLVQSEIKGSLPCSASDAICTVGNVTYFASSEGLVAMSPDGSFKLITNQFFSKAQWTALSPASMKLSADNTQIRIYPAGTLTYIFDLTPEGMILTSVDADHSRYQWKSRKYVFHTPVTFRFFRVTSENGTGSVTIFADGQTVSSLSCDSPNARPRRMEYSSTYAVSGVYAREWQFLAQGASTLIEMEFSQSITEMY